MRAFRNLILFVLAAAVASAPAKVFACPACGSANPNMDHSSMADGMNLAILTLGVVVATVLAGFLTFLVRVIRRSEALEAAAQKKTLEPVKI